jgi:hypothetical protein
MYNRYVFKVNTRICDGIILDCRILYVSIGDLSRTFFKKGKWVFEEWYGDHQEFEYKNQKEGVIDSLPSKLKEVYKRYLNVLNEREMDIVDCGWSNYRMSEKSLIDYMERRIRGEKVKFPDDYFPF